MIYFEYSYSLLYKYMLIGKTMYVRVVSAFNELGKRLGLEGIFWVGALLFLAFQDPYSTTHFTLFLPSLFFDIPSPGLNLGHSISFLFRGDIYESVQAHYLGIPTTIILLLRIGILSKQPQLVTQE